MIIRVWLECCCWKCFESFWLLYFWLQSCSCWSDSRRSVPGSLMSDNVEDGETTPLSSSSSSLRWSVMIVNSLSVSWFILALKSCWLITCLAEWKSLLKSLEWKSSLLLFLRRRRCKWWLSLPLLLLLNPSWLTRWFASRGLLSVTPSGRSRVEEDEEEDEEGEVSLSLDPILTPVSLSGDEEGVQVSSIMTAAGTAVKREEEVTEDSSSLELKEEVAELGFSLISYWLLGSFLLLLYFLVVVSAEKPLFLQENLT